MANGNGRRDGLYYVELIKTVGQFLIYPLVVIILAMYSQINVNKIDTIEKINELKLQMKDINATLSLHQYTTQRQDELVRRLNALELRVDREEEIVSKHRRKSTYDRGDGVDR